MIRAQHPIIVIRRGPEPIPTVAGVAAAEGWPVLPHEPIGALLRRLFHDPAEVAVVEVDATCGPLLRALRDRRRGLAMLAVSEDDAALELLALTSGAHAWLAAAAAGDTIRAAADALRPHSRTAPALHPQQSPLARASA